MEGGLVDKDRDGEREEGRKEDRQRVRDQYRGTGPDREIMGRGKSERLEEISEKESQIE